jgi:hypothetical protein
MFRMAYESRSIPRAERWAELELSCCPSCRRVGLVEVFDAHVASELDRLRPVLPRPQWPLAEGTSVLGSRPS